jgi:septal ring factor EnvC (AmiA/AmiB activator)
MLCLLETLEQFAHLKSEISDLKSLAETVSRQLRAWADSLQNSPIPGQRYLTAKSRNSERIRKERQEFLEELARARRSADDPHSPGS